MNSTVHICLPLMMGVSVVARQPAWYIEVCIVMKWTLLGASLKLPISRVDGNAKRWFAIISESIPLRTRASQLEVVERDQAFALNHAEPRRPDALRSGPMNKLQRSPNFYHASCDNFRFPSIRIIEQSFVHLIRGQLQSRIWDQRMRSEMNAELGGEDKAATSDSELNEPLLAPVESNDSEDAPSKLFDKNYETRVDLMTVLPLRGSQTQPRSPDFLSNILQILVIMWPASKEREKEREGGRSDAMQSDSFHFSLAHYQLLHQTARTHIFICTLELILFAHGSKIKFNMEQNDISEFYSNGAIINQGTNDEICLPNIEELNPGHKLHASGPSTLPPAARRAASAVTAARMQPLYFTMEYAFRISIFSIGDMEGEIREQLRLVCMGTDPELTKRIMCSAEKLSMETVGLKAPGLSTPVHMVEAIKMQLQILFFEHEGLDPALEALTVFEANIQHLCQIKQLWPPSPGLLPGALPALWTTAPLGDTLGSADPSSSRTEGHTLSALRVSEILYREAFTEIENFIGLDIAGVQLWFYEMDASMGARGDPALSDPGTPEQHQASQTHPPFPVGPQPLLTAQQLASAVAGVRPGGTPALSQPVLIPFSMAGQLGGQQGLVLTLPTANLTNIQGLVAAAAAGGIMTLPLQTLQGNPPCLCVL
ncbi:hypothetical protein E2I00_004072 [Balaenoptera physalus]|uniref:Uncharacterized protein n=1 Tax=Balaenoptera physalus TaxID=9770 RepID=A0A643BXA2_BALPH|nr:hypothetical protein E2I00_004072 [Balaenoptera physalus]